jgi:hypothetical protein
VYCIIPTLTVSRSKLISHPWVEHVVWNSGYSHNYKWNNTSSLSSRRIFFPNNHLQIDHLQVLLQSHSIMASKCISKLYQSLAPSASPNTFDDGRQVQLKTCTITALEYIWKFTRTSCGEIGEREGRQPITNHLPHLAWYLKEFSEWNGSGSWSIWRGWEHMRWYLAQMNHTKCVYLWTLDKSAWETPQIVWINDS